MALSKPATPLKISNPLCVICLSSQPYRLTVYGKSKWKKENVEEDLLYLYGSEYVDKVKSLQKGLCNKCTSYIREAVKLKQNSFR